MSEPQPVVAPPPDFAVPTADTMPAAHWFSYVKPFLAPLLITCILAAGHFQYRILESGSGDGTPGTVVAIIVSIVFEMILGKYATGRWPHLASAYITGISVGILVRSQYLWPYIVCSLLSISSKYALRIKDRHLWNPSNLGVSVLLFLAPADVVPLSQQWGNHVWVPIIILGFGLFILFTLGRLHITATYLIAFALLSAFRSAVTGRPFETEIGEVTAPPYILFMCFMITDPKTTPRTWSRQIAVTLAVAVVETILRLFREIHAPYYALFIVFPIANLIEIWWDARRRSFPS
jgi:Na+-transporting NADH:ubiquinone oxidoreductase subunit NqrB